MTIFDWIAMVVLALSVLAGLSRGLLFEVVSLMGWVIAFVLAQQFAQQVGGWVAPSGATWRYAAGFALIFVVILFGIGLVASMVRRLASAAGLRPTDRALGAIFGLARGALVLMAAGVAVHLFSLSRQPWWGASYSAAVVDTALQNAKPALPAKLASYLPEESVHDLK